MKKAKVTIMNDKIKRLMSRCVERSDSLVSNFEGDQLKKQGAIV